MFFIVSRFQVSGFKLRKIASRFFAVLRPSLKPDTCHLTPNKGFSILELLITAAIIGIITAIITLKYGSFNNLILLKNQAYQIAVELRETQVRSLSATSVGSGGQFRQPYGLYFNIAVPDTYTLFRDLDNDNLYNSGEELESVKIDSRFEIASLCSGINCSLATLHIIFKRPNFDAIMNNNTVTDGSIEIKTVSGTDTRVVKINAAGQITVE